MSKPQRSIVLKDSVLGERPRTMGRRPAMAPAIMSPHKAAEPGTIGSPVGAVAAAVAVDTAEGETRGYATGFERGLKDGSAAAAERVAEAVRQATERAKAEVEQAREAERAQIKQALEEHAAFTRRILEQLQRKLEDGVRGLEEQAVSIAFDAVCRIVAEAAPSADAIRAVVRTALAAVRSGPVLRVRLHPGDLATMQSLDAAQSGFSGFAGFSWLADDSVQIGGCLVDTASGTFDARLESQLKRLGAAWRETVAASGAMQRAHGSEGTPS